MVKRMLHSPCPSETNQEIKKKMVLLSDTRCFVFSNCMFEDRQLCFEHLDWKILVDIAMFEM